MVGKILRAIGAADEIARQKRVELLAGMRDLSRIQEVESPFQDIAGALTRCLSFSVRSSSSLALTRTLESHTLANTPTNLACMTLSYKMRSKRNDSLNS